ncbi:DUF4192 family protein [Cellulomonas sp. Y8]|uniref:DUF4192 family protein n=1 Tax=Cellulomonas sp. Y8 TaxID=2591145 RepID=UPI003D714A67
MTSTITLRDPADLLAHVDHALGFRPADSAVLVAVESGRIGLTARVDLAGAIEGATGFLRHLNTDKVQSVTLIAYSDDPAAATQTLLNLRAVVGVGGDSLAVTTAGWFDLTKGVSEVRPLSDITASPIYTAHVYRGSVVAPNRAALLPTALPADVQEQTAEHAAHYLALPAELGSPIDQVCAWTQAEPAAINPQTAGRLAATLADRAVRDAVLVTALGGTTEQVDHILFQTPGAAQAADEVFTGDQAPNATTQHLRDVLAVVVSHTLDTPSLSAEPLALMAFVSWWSGDCARAQVAADAALSRQPDQRLAHLANKAATHGLPPTWARAGR